MPTKPDTVGTGSNSGQNDLRRRHRKIHAMMFADPEEVDAMLVGENRLFNDITDYLRMGKQLTVSSGCYVAESIEAEFERFCHGVF